jgi:hypothetical protein
MSVIDNADVQKNAGTSLIAKMLTREERALAGLSGRNLNELAAVYRGYEVLAPDGPHDAVLVRNAEGLEFSFDPLNRLGQAIPLAAFCHVALHYKDDRVSDGFMRNEYFAPHGGDSSKATCVFVTKRAAVRVLNRTREEQNRYSFPTAEDPELLFAWAGLQDKTDTEGWQYLFSRPLLSNVIFHGKKYEEGTWVHRFHKPTGPEPYFIIEIPASVGWQAPRQQEAAAQEQQSAS